MGLVTIDPNNVNTDDVYFDKDDPETIVHIKLMVWYRYNIRYNLRKTFKNS